MNRNIAAMLCLSAFGLSACGKGADSIVSRSEAEALQSSEAVTVTATTAPAGAYVEPASAPVTVTTQTQSAGSMLTGGGQSVAALDTTSAEEKAAATAPATGGGRLGTTVASLGDATEGGFWIKTPLVSAPGKGRVVNPANGKSVNLDLQPLSGGGAGSQISLAAMQTLGVSITDLPEVEVWQN